MNISRLGMQKHNHSQQTLQLVPMARPIMHLDNSLDRINMDMYGYYLYAIVNSEAISYWNCAIHLYLSKYPAGSWSQIPRSHPWGV